MEYNVGDRVIYFDGRKGVITKYVDNLSIKVDRLFYFRVKFDGSFLDKYDPLVRYDEIKLDEEYYRDLKINQIIDEI